MPTISVSAVLDSYIDDVAELVALGQRSPKTLRQYRSLRRHCFRELRDLDAEALSPVLLRRWLRGVARGTAANPRARGGAAMANAALRLLKIAYKEAEALGLVSRGSSPARYVRELRQGPRTRYLSRGELRALWAALTEAERRRKRGGRAVTPIEAIRLLALTGQRYREILHLRWREVDLAAGVLRLERSKTGPREVALSKAAVQILARQHRRCGAGDFVFPSPRKPGAPMSSVDFLWRKVRAEAGLGGDVCMHTLRHTLATCSQLDGADYQQLAEALGHCDAETTRKIYCRPLATPGARALMEAHAHRITGGKTKH